MGDRCFEVTGNEWKTVTPFDKCQQRVFFMGLEGYTGALRSCGWEFQLLENHFTQKKKLRMFHREMQLIGTGDYVDGGLVIIPRLNNRKVKGVARYRVVGETFNLDELGNTELLEIIARRQAASLPEKPKPQAQVIALSRTA